MPFKKTFYAETPQGFIFKTLVELLNNCLTGDAYFRLEKDGIYSSCLDTHQTILIKINLKRENFLDYECSEEAHIGVNLKHLQKLVKNIKKKDKIIIFIDPLKPRKLGITTMPNTVNPESQKSDTSYITYHNVRKKDFNVDGGYTNPKVIKSVDFQKMCKKMMTVDKTLQITIQGSRYASFYADGGEIISSEMEYGVVDEDSKDIPYNAEFDTPKINQLIKMCPLSCQMQLYAPGIKGNPLRVKMLAGNLGTVEVYVKDKEQIELEKKHKQNKQLVVQ